MFAIVSTSMSVGFVKLTSNLPYFEAQRSLFYFDILPQLVVD